MYTFAEKLREGAQGERFLDAFFAVDWIITPTTASEQRRGIDGYFVHRATGETVTMCHSGFWSGCPSRSSPCSAASCPPGPPLSRPFLYMGGVL